MTGGVSLVKLGEIWGPVVGLMEELDAGCCADGKLLEVTLLADVVGVEALTLGRSRFKLLTIAGAINLSTGKSPGLRLQLGLLAISDDSTSCLLDFMQDLYITFAPRRLNWWPGLSSICLNNALEVLPSLISLPCSHILLGRLRPVSPMYTPSEQSATLHSTV